MWMDVSTIQTPDGKAADYGRQRARARSSTTRAVPDRGPRSTTSRCVPTRSRIEVLGAQISRGLQDVKELELSNIPLLASPQGGARQDCEMERSCGRAALSPAFPKVLE